MRLLGQIKEKNSAQVISDYLYVGGIDNELRRSVDGTWDIWVMDEDSLPAAENILNDFLKNPNDPKYSAAQVPAQRMRAQVRKDAENYHKRTFSARKIFDGFRGHRFNLKSVTGVLIAVSVFIFLVSLFGRHSDFLKYFYITDFEIKGRLIRWSRSLVEIRNGQIWRLVTPIFLHFGFMHILFNMMWLKDLGTIIERNHGPKYFSGMVLVVAVSSNYIQFLVSGPMFGGMSGVVYGLLGFLWIRGKVDPHYGSYLTKQTVIMMIAWFFLCLTGIMGSIANTAHGVGLVSGMIWGYLSAKMRK